MIPAKTDVRAIGNLPGEKVAMSFDEKSTGYLMAIMTDLYSDPELAVIREYSTNALDSHIEAGVSDPIEVTTPSPLSPFLTVRDHGVGLSVADIHDIYSKYGASTKRDSNDAVGMLGLGCKSALTYATQFTLTAVKDGVRTQVAISRDEEGGGSMTIVDTSATDERNGVTVTIPAKQINQIERKAQQFFRYWQAGTVLLNGKEPDHVEGLKLSDSLLLVKSVNYGGNDHVVVMGNVAYPVPSSRLPNQDLGLPGYHYSIVARVPVGAVHFTPSREALHYTPTTLKTLEKIKVDFKAALAVAIQREIDSQPTRTSAINKLIEWREIASSIGNMQFKRKGETIPSHLTVPTVADDEPKPRLLLTASGGSRLSQVSKARTVDLTYFTSSVFVTGYEPDKFTATHKHKLNHWVSEHKKLCFTRGDEGEVRSFVLVDFDLPDDVTKWIDSERIVAWETIKAIKLPRKEPLVGTGRIPGAYDVWLTADLAVARGRNYEGVQTIAGDDIDFSKPVFWIHGNYSAAGYPANILKRFHDSFSIVLLPENRIAKFCREAPQAVAVRDGLEALAKKWYDALTKDEKEAMRLYRTDRYAREELLGYKNYKDQIKDPDVRKAIDVALVPIKQRVEELRTYGNDLNADKLFGGEYANPLEKYPLLNLRSAHVDHNLAYMNFMYERGLTVKP